ncbi:Poly(A) RNA polymerase GLD2 [Bienertia sinuspersici]
MSLEEIVAMFLCTLAHQKKNRFIGFHYFRSGEIGSRQFHICLKVVLKLHEVLLYNLSPISDDCEDESMEACQGKGEESNQGRGKNKRYWTYEEDTVLIRYLHELSGDRKWKSENGFKKRYINKLEELIKYVFPNYGLKVTPHIESRMKY